MNIRILGHSEPSLDRVGQGEVIVVERGGDLVGPAKLIRVSDMVAPCLEEHISRCAMRIPPQSNCIISEADQKEKHDSSPLS